MPYISAKDNCAIYYEEYGNKDAKPLILIHGHGGNHLFFKKQMNDFRKRYHVITYDLRGHGISGMEKKHLTVEQLAEDLACLIEELALERVALLGWSMGASVVLAYIRAYGCDNLSHVIIVDNTAKMINAPDWKYGSFDNPREALDLIVEMAAGWEPYARKYGRIFFGEGACDADDLAWVMEHYRNNTNETMLPLVVSNITSDFRDVLPTIGVPVLLTYGKRKSFYDPAVSYGLAARIPNARVEGFDGGHMHFFQDAENFNQTVIEFLS